MKTVYPAGPITGEDLFDSFRNINAGIEWTARLRDMGFAPFPVFDDFMDIMRTQVVPLEGPKGVYEMSLSWMRKADAILMLPGWRMSKGAVKERKEAMKLEIPVFYHDALEDLWRWRDGCG